jgi:hypothetical protein
MPQNSQLAKNTSHGCGRSRSRPKITASGAPARRSATREGGSTIDCELSLPLFACTLEQESLFDDNRTPPRAGKISRGGKIVLRSSPGCSMKRTVPVLALFLTLAFAAAVSAQFSHGLGTVAGSVLDAQGNPVVDASVTIQTSDGLHPHASHTDATGHFEFTRFDAGQYDLRAYSKGVFSDWQKRVVIRPKKTTEVTLRLAAAAK